MELGYGVPGSRTSGAANFALMQRTYSGVAPKFNRALQLQFAPGQQLELDDDDIKALVAYYTALTTDEERYVFVYETMASAEKLTALLQQLGRRGNLLEQEPEKKNPDLSRSSVRSAGLNTALRQAYAKYPQAQSDAEALIMHDLDTQKNTSQELKSQNQTNQRQDDIDAQLRDIARKQSKKISGLDRENDDLSAELDKLSRELDTMHAQTVVATDRKKGSDSDSVKTPDSDRRDYDTTVSSDSRAEKSQQRSADAEKRKPEPAKLKPNASTVKPLGSTTSTMQMVKPAPVPEPAPTIDVIDQPAEPIPTDAQLPIPVADPLEPPQSDMFGGTDNAQNDKEVDPLSDPEYELPSNVSDLAAHRRAVDQIRQSTASMARNAIQDFGRTNGRTGTNESPELRRMKELAGLTR